MGIGQGNSLDPSLWELASTILLNMMACAGHGVTLSSAISKQQLHPVGLSFVDNTDLVTVLAPNTTGEQILPKLQWSPADR